MTLDVERGHAEMPHLSGVAIMVIQAPVRPSGASAAWEG